MAPTPWSWLRQVHRNRVFTVTRPGEWAENEGDGLVTDRPGCTLAVFTADCAPIVLVAEGSDTDNPVVGVAHAGWRGLACGVVEATVAAMRNLGAGHIRAHLGPCIHPARYEFGPDDLASVTAMLGPEVAGTTQWGTPALDMPAGVTAALRRVGIESVLDEGVCTAEDPRYYSHRARGEVQRQAGVVWLEAGS